MNLMQEFRKDVVGILSRKVPRKLVEEGLEKPPENIGSDLAYPCFALSKRKKRNPAQLAREISSAIRPSGMVGEINFYGPYINFFIDWKKAAPALLRSVLREKDDYGRGKRTRKRVMVEYSAPNTNKPLHLGHLRNGAIGMSVASILGFAGHDVVRANLFSNRGSHICKSMLAYRKWGRGTKPAVKPDHFVGRFYVMFEKRKTKKLEKEVNEMLRKWESGDREVMELWRKMDSWATEGFRKTYERFGSEFDAEFRESDFWDKAGPVIERGLKKRVFRKEKDGAVVADLEKEGLGKKAILRSDDTSIYITNDLALTVHKFRRFRLDESVWVVGSEQNTYFRQLFMIFRQLGYPWAERCRHLSYGLVFLPEGKMKSREGKVVDADDIMDDMQKLAAREIKKREKRISRKELDERALQIGLAALKYFFLRVDSLKDIHFNPAESLSFEGDTGPYMQYSHARACSILRKAGKGLSGKRAAPCFDNLKEIALLKQIADFPDAVQRAAKDMKPHYIAGYCLDLSARFNDFYHSVAVLKASGVYRQGRLDLVRAIGQTLNNALKLLGIEAPEKM